MKRKLFSAILYREGDVYVAECPEVGTASQGKSVDEALINLQEATELYLEEFPEKLPHEGKPFVTIFEAKVA